MGGGGRQRVCECCRVSLAQDDNFFFFFFLFSAASFLPSRAVYIVGFRPLEIDPVVTGDHCGERQNVTARSKDPNSQYG